MNTTTSKSRRIHVARFNIRDSQILAFYLGSRSTLDFYKDDMTDPNSIILPRLRLEHGEYHYNRLHCTAVSIIMHLPIYRTIHVQPSAKFTNSILYF